MRLHFTWTEVQKALDEARNASTSRTLYGSETGPGLWLVGDHGVYLMPNCTDAPRTIVYAQECSPETSPDTWWDVKRATFGGDDGAQFIALQTIDSLAADNSSGRWKPNRLAIAFPDNAYSINISIEWIGP